MLKKPGRNIILPDRSLTLNDKPVSGAIVLVDNKNTQIVTYSKGLYKVRVKTNATRIAVFKPMNGQRDEKINGRTVINFRLNSGTPIHTILSDGRSF